MLPKDLVTVPQMLVASGPEEVDQSGEELLYLQMSLGDRYRIRDYIAGGGMGSVYAAEDTGLRRPVAIKVIHLPKGADSRGVHQRRFIQEMTALGSIRHPNVVTVYGQGGDGTKQRPLHLIMEHLGGLTLTSYIRHRGTIKTSFPLKDGKVSSQGALELGQAIRLIRPIAEGLEAMHAGGLIHRDLKGDNVIVDINEKTGSERPVLIDFGLVKMSPTPEDGRTVIDLPKTEAGMIFGTVQYMPPEQLRGKVLQHTDYFVDTYALTCIFYEMLAGFVPFANILSRELGDERTSLEQDMMAWMSVHARSLSFLPICQLRPELPPWLDAFFEKGLARESDQRFQTAGEFLRAIDAGVAAEAERQRELAETQRRQQEALQHRTILYRRLKMVLVGGGLLGLCVLAALILPRPQRRVVSHPNHSPVQVVDAGVAIPVVPLEEVTDAGRADTEDGAIHDADASVFVDVVVPPDVTSATDAGLRRRRRPPVRRCGGFNPSTGTLIPCFH